MGPLVLQAAVAVVAAVGGAVLLYLFLAWLFGVAPHPEGAAADQQQLLADMVKIALGLAAGVGAAVALVIGYRRARVEEAGSHRDDHRLFSSRYQDAAELIGHARAAVRLAGIYAMSRLADDWAEQRQQCIDVLCAYLRLPYNSAASEPGEREVRLTVIRIITAHLQYAATPSWRGLELDFTGAVFDGGHFAGADFSGWATFSGAEFSGDIDFTAAAFGTDSFTDAKLSGNIEFTGATFDGGDFIGGAFSGAKFSGDIDFTAAEFSSGSTFAGAEFSDGTVTFVQTVFSGNVLDFSSTNGFSDAVNFGGAIFSGSTIDFNEARFSSGDVVFDSAVFAGGSIDFNGARFSDGIVSFRQAEFSGSTVSFDRVELSGSTVDFNDSQYASGQVDLSAAILHSGGTLPRVLPEAPAPDLKLPTT